jgi:hypothetical protein
MEFGDEELLLGFGLQRFPLDLCALILCFVESIMPTTCYLELSIIPMEFLICLGIWIPCPLFLLDFYWSSLALALLKQLV